MGFLPSACPDGPATFFASPPSLFPESAARGIRAMSIEGGKSLSQTGTITPALLTHISPHYYCTGVSRRLLVLPLPPPPSRTPSPSPSLLPMDITSTSTKGSQLPRRYKCKYEGCGKAFTKVGLFLCGG